MSNFKTIRLNLKPLKSLKNSQKYGYNRDMVTTQAKFTGNKDNISSNQANNYVYDKYKSDSRVNNYDSGNQSNNFPKYKPPGKNHFQAPKKRTRSENKSILIGQFIKENPILCVLLLLLIIGIIIGSFLAGSANSNLINNIEFLFMNNFRVKGSIDFLEILFSSIISSSMLLFIAIFMGMSMIGTITVPLLCILKGIGIGVSSAYLFITYGGTGFLFNSLIILPGALISSFALLICSHHCVLYSVNVFARSVPLKKRPRYFYTFKGFMSKVYKCFFLTGISAIIDTVLTFYFSGLFNL